MNISKMNKAEVLSRLFNASKQKGLGLLDASGCSEMSIDEAQTFLDEGCTYFDYLKGRVIKVDLSGDDICTELYDRDNGQGAAALALAV